MDKEFLKHSIFIELFRALQNTDNAIEQTKRVISELFKENDSNG